MKLINCKHCSVLPPLGQLPSLTELYIDGLEGVVTVDQEFYGNSCSLMKPFERLKLLSLENMPNWENWFHFGAEVEVETFSQLEEFYIGYCPKLRGSLPVHLPSLAKLKIRDCHHLEASVPIDSFPVLTLVKIDSCGNLKSLTHGRSLDFNSCLQELSVSGCYSLVSLPKAGLLTLKKLKISYCNKLELLMHPQYSSLEEFLLKDSCDSLISFPLDPFPNLKSIIINGCKNLQSLEHYGADDLLILNIGIERCPSFVSFPKGGLRAPNLVMFFLQRCESLRSIPEKMQLFLPSLHYFKIQDCPEIESFPEGGLPSNLKEIVIKGCKKLSSNWREWGLQILPSLEFLRIGGESEDVESFPGKLLLPTTLTHLDINSFKNLESLEDKGFRKLTSLVQLVIYDCPKLKHMPEEGFPPSLSILRITSCPLLEKELKSKKGKEWLKVARVPNILYHGYIQGVHWPDFRFRRPQLTSS